MTVEENAMFSPTVQAIQGGAALGRLIAELSALNPFPRLLR